MSCGQAVEETVWAEVTLRLCVILYVDIYSHKLTKLFGGTVGRRAPPPTPPRAPRPQEATVFVGTGNEECFEKTIIATTWSNNLHSGWNRLNWDLCVCVLAYASVAFNRLRIQKKVKINCSYFPANGCNHAGAFVSTNSNDCIQTVFCQAEKKKKSCNWNNPNKSAESLRLQRPNNHSMSRSWVTAFI